jgi:hypothetical protein
MAHSNYRQKHNRAPDDSAIFDGVWVERAKRSLDALSATRDGASELLALGSQYGKPVLA